VQAGLTEVTGVTSLAVLGTTLYAGTYTCTETFDGAFACPGSVFRSEDNGDSWTEANIELGDSIVTTFLISGGILYLGASGRGVFQSKDNGKSWTEANTGLTNLFISSLAVLGDTLYAGTGGSGVFRARLPSHNHKVAVQPRGKMPFTLGAIKETALLQNYPNPFNPETWMPFVLHEATEVEIRIYNVPGQLVRTLQLGRKAPGIYLNKAQAAYWDGTNDDGEAVGSGIYFYQMHAGSNTFVRKAVLLK
jgi:hypothetical protein